MRTQAEPEERPEMPKAPTIRLDGAEIVTEPPKPEFDVEIPEEIINEEVPDLYVEVEEPAAPAVEEAAEEVVEEPVVEEVVEACFHLQEEERWAIWAPGWRVCRQALRRRFRPPGWPVGCLLAGAGGVGRVWPFPWAWPVGRRLAPISRRPQGPECSLGTCVQALCPDSSPVKQAQVFREKGSHRAKSTPARG